MPLYRVDRSQSEIPISKAWVEFDDALSRLEPAIRGSGSLATCENLIRESGFPPQLVERSLPFVGDSDHGVRAQAESSHPTPVS